MLLAYEYRESARGQRKQILNIVFCLDNTMATCYEKNKNYSSFFLLKWIFGKNHWSQKGRLPELPFAIRADDFMLGLD